MEDYHQKLRRLIIEYIVLGYKTLQLLPKDELYAMTAQCKRSMTSIFLNYIEGYARARKKVMKNLYETSYGSLLESIGVFLLATHLNYISKDQYMKLFARKEEIAKMLWKTINGIGEDVRTK